MRPYIAFEGGGGSDARRSARPAPCLPPASRRSTVFSPRRGGCRSSTKETRLPTRVVCLCPHARCRVKQKRPGRERARKEGSAREGSLQPQQYVSGLLTASAAQPRPSPINGSGSWARFILSGLNGSPFLPICFSPRPVFFQQPRWVCGLKKGRVLDKTT